MDRCQSSDKVPIGVLYKDNKLEGKLSAAIVAIAFIIVAIREYSEGAERRSIWWGEGSASVYVLPG